jgi:peroxiredoxin Q/BCP
VLGAVAILALIFTANLRSNTPEGESSASGYPFQVGSPGPGDQAPPLVLPAADGTSFDLAAEAGNTVLLYFQEGLMCQPCWDQLAEIEASWDDFTALGIDQIATVTTDPAELLRRARVDQAFTSPVLSDADARVSETWGTLDFGMMGGSHNGHSFILVGPDGTIQWRADYGGAPDYTMYLPVPALLTDLTDGLDAG